MNGPARLPLALSAALAWLGAALPASAAEPPPTALVGQPVRSSEWLYAGGVALTSVGGAGVVMGTFLGNVVLDHNSSSTGPLFDLGATVPIIASGVGVMSAGVTMLVAGRDRDYGRPVPRRSLGLAAVGVGLMSLGTGAVGLGTALSSVRTFAGEPSSLPTYVPPLITIAGLGVLGGGLAMFLVGSAQAPEKVGVYEVGATVPAVRLDFPTVGVSPLYSQREVSRYGLTQGTEVRLELIRGAF